MRIARITKISLLLAAAVVAACGSDDTPSEQSSDPFLRGLFRCGNGRIDRREQCDRRNLNRQTCATVTMGARPRGTLTCSAFCRFDTRRCTRASGAGGAGGSGGSGGVGTGGTAGSGGDS
jgi:hypothetical protein